MTKMNVESFSLDHTKMVAPLIRLAGTMEELNGDVIRKYSIHFKQPNKEHMDMPGLHSLEHLMAKNIRNHSDKIVDLSPMDCQTGFYVLFINHDNYDDVLNVVEVTLNDVLNAAEVPACSEVQRGWAASHSLEGVKTIVQALLDKRNERHDVFGIGKQILVNQVSQKSSRTMTLQSPLPNCFLLYFKVKKSNK